MNRPLTVVFAGGGTGGHLFPGLAVADALCRCVPGARISFAGSPDRIEATVVPRYGYEFDPIWVSGFRRRLSFSTFLFPIKLTVSLWQAFRIMRRRAPQVVVGTGGYVSGPVVYVASLMGLRTLVQEQNATPGATTRMLAKRADEVHVTFEETGAMLAGVRNIHVSGNPVRLSLCRRPVDEARGFFGLDPAVATVFAFGGSLGASSINSALANLLPRFADAGVQLLWQTGTRDAAMAKNAAAGMRNVVVRDFIHEMDAAYSAATLVLCRAGATSIAELTALGIPAILVPYPHAAADHQRRNARALALRGAARVVEDASLHTLGDMMFPLLNNMEELGGMADASGRMGRPDAAQRVADAILRLASPGKA